MATGLIGMVSNRSSLAVHMLLENISAHAGKTKVAWMALWACPVIATRKVRFGPVMMEELLQKLSSPSKLSIMAP